MTKPPMNAAGVHAALSMMRPPVNISLLRRWISRQRVMAHVAAYDSKDTPIEIARQRIAERTGMSANTVRDALESLVSDRVLQCQSGFGQTSNAYRFTADVRLWKVEWHLPISAVEAGVGLATGEIRIETPQLSRVVYNARQRRFVARSMSRATKKQLSRDSWDARQSEQLSRDSWDARQMKDSGVESSLSTDRVASVPALSDEERGRVDQICAAVARRVEARWIWGTPRKQVEHLVQGGATVSEVLALVASIPPECQAKSGVEWLLQAWQGRQISEWSEPDFEAQLQGLRRQEENLLNMAATWEDEDDQELLAETREKLAEVQTELRRVESLIVRDQDERRIEA